jgi:hypothetical protein
MEHKKTINLKPNEGREMGLVEVTISVSFSASDYTLNAKPRLTEASDSNYNGIDLPPSLLHCVPQRHELKLDYIFVSSPSHEHTEMVRRVFGPQSR